MSKYVIETENLRKEYNGHAVVDSLSLHVPEGRIYALLGRNGAGKTTTMKMLLNLIQPSGGKICLFGEDHSDFSKKHYHRIGSIIESPAFYENLTAEENLEILARLRGRHRRDTVEHALSVVNLDRENKNLFREYSLGMKQRLGLAAAVMHEPELLILDEPINGLDPVGIHETREYLLQLCREKGTTILISSHVLNEIEQIADVIGVMKEGRQNVSSAFPITQSLEAITCGCMKKLTAGQRSITVLYRKELRLPTSASVRENWKIISRN